MRRAAGSSDGVVFCVWLSGSHLFLHKQETLQSTQTSNADSSMEDGLASSLREVRLSVYMVLNGSKNVVCLHLNGYSCPYSGK